MVQQKIQQLLMTHVAQQQLVAQQQAQVRASLEAHQRMHAQRQEEQARMWRRYQEAQAAKAAAVAQKAAARAERLRLAEEAREANRRRRALEEKANEWRAVRKRLCTASNGCERDGVPTLEGLALVAVASREGELPALDALEARRACLEAQVVLRVSTGRDAAVAPT